MTTTPIVLANAAPDAAAQDASRSVEAFRYLLASIAALMVDAGLLGIGVGVFGIASWIAGAIAYLAGLVLIYLLSIHWVFGRRAMTDRTGEFLVFAALGLVGLILNSTTLYLATAAGLALPIAKVLSAAIGFVTNFVSRKVILFNEGAK